MKSEEARVGATVEWTVSGRPKRGVIKSIARSGSVFVVSPRQPYQRNGMTICGEDTRCFATTELDALILVTADAT